MESTMPINDNMNKWMTLLNTLANIKQEIASSNSNNKGRGDSVENEEQKKPNFLAWFNNTDERLWAELFHSLDRDSQRADIVRFLEDLAPVNPQTFAEKTAKKINQTIFRHIVTGLSVKEAGSVLKREVVTGSGKTKKVDKTYSISNSLDHRKQFLIWLSRSVHMHGTAYTRNQLAVANIIVSDEVMESSMLKLTKIIDTIPESFKDIGDGITKANKGLRIFNLYAGLLILPTMWGVYHFFATNRPIYAITVLLLAITVGIIGAKQGDSQ